jgi:putative peptidoglycan lipid II flippase
LSTPTDVPAPPDHPGATEGAHRSRLARAAGLVSILTLLSRLLGLVREQLFAALLGAGFYSDAFQIAFRIPNLLRDLFAEGALSAAFVPTFTDYLTNRSRAQAHQLANRVMTVLALLLGVLVVLGLIFAHPLVALLGHGFPPDKRAVCVELTRIMLPFLPLVSFAAVAMGMLNAEERYGAPALSSSMFNVVAILGGLGFAAARLPPAQTVVGWSIAVLAGGAAQYFIQVPPLARLGFRFRPQLSLRDEGIRRIARLMTPATLGLAAVQINIVVGSVFASRQEGAASWLNYAFRLLYLPIGIFGVAIGTIAATGLARRAAERDRPGMQRTMRQSLRLVAFLTIPSTFGLVALGRPIIRLIYQHGRFDAHSTDATAQALLFYSLGLFAYSAIKVLAPAFYALDQPRLPLLGSIASVATNLVINFTLYPWLGYRGVALGTSLGALVNFSFLAVQFEREVGGIRGGGLLRTMVKVMAASLVMAAVAWVAAQGLERVLGVRGLGIKLVVSLAPVALGALVYAGCARLLGIEEMDDFVGFLRRRLGRRAGSA